jgi:nicotinate phosphoribosyltransferase
VYRRYAAEGSFLGDTVTLETDALPAEPLIVPVMHSGRRLPQPSLEESRKHCLRQLARLPKAFPYPVEVSPALRAAAEEVDRSLLTTRTMVGS